MEGTHQIERFFPAVAGLDVDKEDLRRYYNFVDQKVADLLLVAQHKTKASDRVRVELRDLPITKGLQESIHAFEALDLDIGLERILERNVPEPPFDQPYSDEVDARLPIIAGGLSLAARAPSRSSIRRPGTLQPNSGNAFQIFDLLL